MSKIKKAFIHVNCVNTGQIQHEVLNVASVYLGVLQTKWPQRDGRAHVYAATDVQTDQKAEERPV